MFVRTLLASTLIVASLAAPAFAGECPADKMKADAIKPVDYGPKGVTDNVLSMIDLSKEKVAVAGHVMRVRRLEVQPGGIVPWHSHAERPALI
jgi:quercetin dioxygenase-like cupin family protein